VLPSDLESILVTDQDGYRECKLVTEIECKRFILHSQWDFDGIPIGRGERFPEWKIMSLGPEMDCYQCQGQDHWGRISNPKSERQIRTLYTGQSVAGNFFILKVDPLTHSDLLQSDTFFRGFGGFSSRFGRYNSGFGLSSDYSERANGDEDASNSDEAKNDIGEIFRCKQTREIALRMLFGPIFLGCGCLLIYHVNVRGRRWSWLRFRCRLLQFTGLVCVSGGWGAFVLPIYYLHDDCNGEDGDKRLHGPITVTQKLLTSTNYCNTVLAIGRAHMANVLGTEKQVAIIGGLAEGSSIRSIERITGVHRDTIMRLGVRVGKGCASLLDSKMRNLPCKYLQFDELWGFIGKKERHCTPQDSLELGDVWTFCAIDSDTKLVPSFKVGKRDLVTANAFVSDVASRMKNRVQISSDALRAYVDAIEINFGADVDFAQIIKTYVTDDSHIPERRFSAPEIVITEKKAVTGFPDMALASTSHIERLNGTTRLHMRRLTRLTYAFSKKLENFEAAVALHFAYYNLVKRHGTLRCTPAMAAGVEKSFWSVGDLIEAVV
jgi:IS1 family transposase